MGKKEDHASHEFPFKMSCCGPRTFHLLVRKAALVRGETRENFVKKKMIKSVDKTNQINKLKEERYCLSVGYRMDK